MTESTSLTCAYPSFEQRVVEALGMPYGEPEMFGHTRRYPTHDEIVSWVASERRRVTVMHDGHHADVVGFCPRCGMYGLASASGDSGASERQQ